MGSARAPRPPAAARCWLRDGPAGALQIVDGITGLDDSYLLPSVRGELLSRLGRHAEATIEFEKAAAMTANERERTVLLTKAAAVTTGLRA